MHVRRAPKYSKLVAVTERSWNTIRSCAELWKDVKSEEGEYSLLNSQELSGDTPPAGGAYHQACYSAYCNKVTIERKLASRQLSYNDTSEYPMPAASTSSDGIRKILRSKSIFRYVPMKNVLPHDICLVCGKAERFYLSCGLKKRSRMMAAETEDGGG